MYCIYILCIYGHTCILQQTITPPGNSHVPIHLDHFKKERSQSSIIFQRTLSFTGVDQAMLCRQPNLTKKPQPCATTFNMGSNLHRQLSQVSIKSSEFCFLKRSPQKGPNPPTVQQSSEAFIQSSLKLLVTWVLRSESCPPLRHLGDEKQRVGLCYQTSV